MTTKLMNSVESCVDDALRGLVATNHQLTQLRGQRVVLLRRPLISDTNGCAGHRHVALVSGGGAGHEPAHGGFVGAGMLTAAVSGDIFASPPTSAVYAAIEAAAVDSSGVLVIVKNYTGDRLNFGLAVERARHRWPVEMVVVGDDCALDVGGDGDRGPAKRRGLAGTLLVHKIAGAAAAEGFPLDRVAAMARLVADSMATISLSTSACQRPGEEQPSASFQLPIGFMELGLGIHGEAGVSRVRVGTARCVVVAMLDCMFRLVSTCPNVPPRKFTPTESIVVLINNLGAMTSLEVQVIAGEVLVQLKQLHAGVVVERVVCGTLMTSLDMSGVSVTVLNLPAEWKDTFLRLLDAPTSATAWPGVSIPHQSDSEVFHPFQAGTEDVDRFNADMAAGGDVEDQGGADAVLMAKCLSFAGQALISCTGQLNLLDGGGAGDGDCGSTLAKACTLMMTALEADQLLLSRPRRLLLQLAGACESVGGTSGAIYGIGLTSASQAFTDLTGTDGWRRALRLACDAIELYGGARPGDRTMLDSLTAACSAVTASNLPSDTSPPSGEHVSSCSAAVSLLLAAAEAAEAAAISTVGMPARSGRASYVSSHHLVNPDPGAHAVGIWMRAIAEAAKSHYRQHRE